MNFLELIHIIAETEQLLKQKVLLAVNQTLTIKNWLTGFYIVEFEQNGVDRAKYGEKLIPKMSTELTNKKMKGYSITNLKLNRQFYLAYPQISRTMPDLLINQLNNNKFVISQTLSDQFNIEKIYQTLSDKLTKANEFILKLLP